ncbi:MAG TPA: isochorismatase family cysteine hydrolase [Chitinophagaceae bacterium]|nr:isochorismatase family cysteine hydrolase [Chitinophagaceae bacterium]
MNKNSALLVMDMQTTILKNLPDATSFIENVTKAIAHARAARIPVIYVRVGFRTGFPEISSQNKSFTAARERWANVTMEELLGIHPAVSPKPDEIVVTKRRISAFTGSDLEVVLRSQNIKHIILTGISTSGVVLSTVREAADKDYQITVLSDGCADTDEEVHRVLTSKVFPRQADVLTVALWQQD